MDSPRPRCREDRARGRTSCADRGDLARRGEYVRLRCLTRGRDPATLTAAHLVFITVRPTYEAALDEAAEILSARYRQDFREPAKKYCVLGPPAACAEQLRRYADAGVRHLILSPIVPVAQHPEQFERIARDVLPALRGA